MPRRLRPLQRATALLMLATGWSRGATAQVQDAGARMERLADGVYAIVHDDATDEWPHSNTGVVISEDGVLVVDATYLPSRARADIALIHSVTDKPVRYLVYTHWHMDHNNGAVSYRSAFPGITIASERETAEFIALNSVYWAKRSTAPGSTRRAAIAELEREVAAGQDSSGHALTAEEKRRLGVIVRQRKGELDELATLEVVVPNLVFDRTLTLQLGRRRIELRDHGRANSPHDVTIYLPDEKILFTGDIVVQSPLPFVGASWPVPWIEVLRGLEAVPITAIVPGHGPVMHDYGYTRQVRELLEACTTRVAAMARRGKSLEEIQDSVGLEDVRRRTPPWNGAKLDADWKTTARILVERAWRGVRGQG